MEAERWTNTKEGNQKIFCVTLQIGNNNHAGNKFNSTSWLSMQHEAYCKIRGKKVGTKAECFGMFWWTVAK